jgi:ribosomal protein L18
MAVVTQPNVSLVVSLDGQDYACQVIDASFKPPGVGASTVTETACPSGVVAEPGSIEAGTFTGNVFADSLDAGVTYVLALAYETQSEFDYIVTFWPELGPTKAMQYTGRAKVASFQLDFAKPGIGKHPLDLELSTATLGRPAAAA